MTNIHIMLGIVYVGCLVFMYYALDYLKTMEKDKNTDKDDD